MNTCLSVLLQVSARHRTKLGPSLHMIAHRRPDLGDDTHPVIDVPTRVSGT